MKPWIVAIKRKMVAEQYAFETHLEAVAFLRECAQNSMQVAMTNGSPIIFAGTKSIQSMAYPKNKKKEII